jgi:ketol-acid reductoisomerase
MIKNNQKNNDDDFVIIGFGNQAKAWALNLRDSFKLKKIKTTIHIALRPKSSNERKVKSLGFSFISMDSKKIKLYKNFIVLIPDQTHLEIFEKYSANFNPGSRFFYAHGFSVTYHQLPLKYPQFSHILFAIKSIANQIRLNFETKGKLTALYSMEHSLNPKEDLKILKFLAKNVGVNSLLISSTFKDETTADLFSEQSLLCGLLPYAINASFEVLVKNSIDPKTAFFECWHELKLIVDTMINVGPVNFFQLISPNALFGAHVSSNLLIDKNFKKKFDLLWKNIHSGKFFHDLENSQHDITRREILNFWKDQPLQKVFNELSPKLYK